MMPSNNVSEVREGIVVKYFLRGCWIFVGGNGVVDGISTTRLYCVVDLMKMISSI